MNNSSFTDGKRIAVVDVTTTGSTGKIATGICEFYAKQGVPVHFCYGMGSKPNIEKSYKIDTVIERLIHGGLSRITGYQGYFSTFATKRLIEYLKKNKVNAIFALELHGYYLNEKLFFSYLREQEIKFVYIMVDEYPLYGKCGYRGSCSQFLNGCHKCPKVREYPKSLFFDRSSKIFNDKKISYSGLKYSCFVGPEFVVNQAKKSPLTANMSFHILDEAIDTDFYSPRTTVKLRRKLGIAGDRVIIVCVAPSGKGYERKGTQYFEALANKFVNNDRYVFVHVGYKGSIAKLPSNYIPIGFVENQEELAQYYSLGDLFVFPSLLDTMPNACLEALSCGTPLMCFNISGMPYIGDQNVLSLIEAGNVDEMADKILETKKKTDEMKKRCREYAIYRYSRNNYCKKLENIMNCLFEV